MSVPPNQDAARYATCYCCHCDGGIEFDASTLQKGEVRIVPCPHCGNQTKVFAALPVQDIMQTQPAAESKVAAETVDYTTGLYWARKAAEAGDAESMAHLGIAYFEGLGFEKDYAEAVKWLRLAAEHGNTTGQNNLGVCYIKGCGVNQDFVEGERWIRKAAEKGDSSAQYHLGCLYHLGQGVAKDATATFFWWLKAAEAGYAIAQNNIGYMYEQGEPPAPKDCIDAYKWMQLAAFQKYEGASTHCEEMASKMSRIELEEGRRRTGQFIEKTKGAKELEGTGWFWRIIRHFAQEGDAEAQTLLAVSETTDYVRRPIPSKVRNEVWRRDEGKCAKCGSRMNLEYDHIIPVSKGGSSTARNIELLCESCNRQKSATIQ